MLLIFGWNVKWKDNVPIEKEQQDKSREVGLRNIRLLLETDEDQHHQRGRDGVVQLKTKCNLHW